MHYVGTTVRACCRPGPARPGYSQPRVLINKSTFVHQSARSRRDVYKPAAARPVRCLDRRVSHRQVLAATRLLQLRQLRCRDRTQWPVHMPPPPPPPPTPSRRRVITRELAPSTFLADRRLSHSLSLSLCLALSRSISRNAIYLPRRRSRCEAAYVTDEGRGTQNETARKTERERERERERDETSPASSVRLVAVRGKYRLDF